MNQNTVVAIATINSNDDSCIIKFELLNNGNRFKWCDINIHSEPSNIEDHTYTSKENAINAMRTVYSFAGWNLRIKSL